MISESLKMAGIPKEWKTALSVRKAGDVELVIKSAPVDLLAKINESNLRFFNLNGYGESRPLNHVSLYHVEDRDFEGESQEVMKKIILALNEFNYDNSDIQFDYFDRGYSACISIGTSDRPFVVQ